MESKFEVLVSLLSEDPNTPTAMLATEAKCSRRYARKARTYFQQTYMEGNGPQGPTLPFKAVVIADVHAP